MSRPFPRFHGFRVGATAAVALAVALAGPSLTGSVAAAEEIPLDERWQLRGDARIDDRTGTAVLQTDSGGAALGSVELQDGTLEVEVQVSGHRSFVYVVFRDQGDGQREEIYLRGHKSHAPDGVQYSPVLGRSQWQLFHGEGGTAAAPLPPNEWIPLRLEMRGRKLAVFVGRTERPTLTVARMSHEPRPGGIALSSFLTADSEAPYGARFRNVRVTSGRTTYDFDALEAPEIEAEGLVRRWRMSTPFAIEEKLASALPETSPDGWRVVETEPDGVALLDRVGGPEGARAFGAVLALDLEAEQAGVRTMDLGFSDAATVFLNGAPIVGLDQSYRFDRPRVQGVLGLHQARLFLPLRRGPNELRIVVTESFGGWGIVGRIHDPEGLRIRP